MHTPIMNWLIENSVETLVLTALVLPTCWALRSRPALCHVLWLAVLIKLVAPPLDVHGLQPHGLTTWLDGASTTLTRWLGQDDGVATPRPAGPAELADTASTDYGAKPAGSADSAEARTAGSHESPSTGALPGSRSAASRAAADLGDLLLGAWLAGSLWVLATQVRRARRFQQLVDRAPAASAALVRAVRETADRMGVAAPPVQRLAGLSSPVTWSLGSPRLLWPAAADGSEWPPDRGIVAHELGHLARRDHWVAWFELAARVGFWWHPLFWLARRRLHRYAEQSCDAWAVWAFPEGRRAYAEALLDVAAVELRPVGSAHSMTPALAVTDGEPRDLHRRLTMIMQPKVSRRASPLAAAAVLLATAVLLPGAQGGEPHAAGAPTALPDDIDPLLAPALEQAATLHAFEVNVSGDADPSLSIPLLESLLQAEPDDLWLFAELGKALAATGRSTDALPLLQRAAAESDQPAGALWTLAGVMSDLGRPDDALTALTAALEHGLPKAAAHFDQAPVQALQGLAAYEALQLRAVALSASIASAEAAVKSENWEQAVADWRKVVELAPRSGFGWHMLAYSLFGVSDFDAALAAAAQQKRLHYRAEVADYNSACALARKGDVDGGLAALDAAWQAGFRDTALLAHDSDLDNLRSDERFVQLAARAASFGDQVARADAAFSTGDTATAVALYAGLVAQPVVGPQFRDRLANALLGEARYEEAAALARELILSGQNVAGGAVVLARAEAGLGHDERALSYLAHAIGLGYAHPVELLDTPQLASLRDDPRFTHLVLTSNPAADPDLKQRWAAELEEQQRKTL